jgi:lysophospholipid acyltransferase (LPLAT)-like uncharacterized protein
MAQQSSLWGRMFDATAALAIRAWMGTLRIHVDAQDPSLDPRSGSKGHIYCFWHEDLVFHGGLMAGSGTHAMISRSRDGERIARIMQRLGLQPVRGSSNRGGANAALEVLRLGAEANVGIAVDGPRGPRRRMQPGAVFLASRTGMPLVAIGASYHRPWRVRSWDQMAFARPWSRAVVSASAAIHVPPDLDDVQLSQYRDSVESTMHEQSARADSLVQQWVASGSRPAAGEELSVADLKAGRRAA